MTLGQGLIGVAALYVICGLAYMAWAGRIDHGGQTVVDRHKAPIVFWMVWVLLVGVFSVAITSWLDLA